MLQRRHHDLRHIVAPAVSTFFFPPLSLVLFFSVFVLFLHLILTEENVAHISRETQVRSSASAQICETQLGISLSEMKDSFLLRSFTTCPWAILKNVFTRNAACVNINKDRLQRKKPRARARVLLECRQMHGALIKLKSNTCFKGSFFFFFGISFYFFAFQGHMWGRRKQRKAEKRRHGPKWKKMALRSRLACSCSWCKPLFCSAPNGFHPGCSDGPDDASPPPLFLFLCSTFAHVVFSPPPPQSATVIPCCPTLPFISSLSSYFLLAFIVSVPSSEAKSDLFRTPTFSIPPLSSDLSFLSIFLLPLLLRSPSLINLQTLRIVLCFLAASSRFVLLLHL